MPKFVMRYTTEFSREFEDATLEEAGARAKRAVNAITGAMLLGVWCLDEPKAKPDVGA